ncbi:MULTISPECIES: PSD1 and planctomycete cytochrome C domain-containing protein [Arenibacter]|uniref:PSD1 and planctomycete cytochrome C domain-containing protein n=1 Tax=Arenibacter TaxID=178469 RepID=UPI001C06E936|nr:MULTISPECIES: PSD1 and planctomycete cytochrome C domain-containing protein [Arenibacter]MBU2903976.1 PSD1 and planctomycete cytochrome C domain-containing protein [Arenibacter algicola]MCK0135656.1 PSD1 and planctomycete cytochrome C domain-containing protein [Arenibacter sp. S6351L]
MLVQPTKKFLTRSLTGLYSLLVSIPVLVAFGCNTGVQTSETTVSNDINGRVPDKIDFTFHVKPILSDRCFKCHGPDKNAIEGGLSLNTAEDAYMALGKKKDHYAIVPGDVEKSELVNRIYTADESLMMPPPESNLTLTQYEKEVLKKWIDQGAEYKEHWAFIAPEKPIVPKTTNTTWAQNEIDQFVLAQLEQKGLQPSEKASKEKLLRRVFFDLTGLPPSVEQINNFVNNDSPTAFEEIIDSLLNTMDYAEHMSAEWMDIARYADTHGYQDDFERIMWPWRDWVIHAFKQNMPYDQFVTYQLAGDLLPNANAEQILATGFNRNHKITFEGGVIPEEYRIEYVEDRAVTFGTAFLGLTFECARCHDHKYDPISQKNHFELFSFFNNIDELGLTPGGAGKIPKPYMTITEKEKNGILSFVQLQKSTMKEVPVMVMNEMEEIRPSYILNRGVYDQPTTQVYPNTPESILPFPEEYPKNRLGLAKWLFHEDNPLTARVTVNRYWQRMFGTGLVASSFDFGNQGSLPTHPELLDFLAIKLKEEGWDSRKILKYMALSATYQQSTKVSKELQELDPENRLLARAPRLRLTAELIRDQALKISGLLNKEVGGPSVKPYQPAGIWEATTGGGGGSTATYITSTGKDLYRKSLYTFWKRTVPPPSMMTFDAASRDLCTVKRQETNTPLQALVLLNDPQIIEASRLIAKNAIDRNKEISEQIKYIFKLATSRTPDEEELSMLNNYYNSMLQKVDEEGIDPQDYLSIGDFEIDSSYSKNQLAALALTAHTILNLDETITRG